MSKITIEEGLDYRTNSARLAGAMHGYTEESQAYGQAQSAKIIPFPVMRHTETETPFMDRFQNEIDDFLREMGYIE
jgi:hypothetical protein